jgi:hypothetical protein
LTSFDTARDDIALALALGADLADPDLAELGVTHES